MLFRAGRTDQGPDPGLDQRIFLFVIGSVVGVTGIGLEKSWLVYVAIGILALGMILGMIRKRRARLDE